MAFSALDAAVKDPDIAKAIEGMQSNVVDATIQAMSNEEVGEAVNDNLFHWVQVFPNQYSEERHFMWKKRLMGIVRIRLDSGDKIKIDAELMPPDSPEKLALRDPSRLEKSDRVFQPPAIPSKVLH